MKRYVISDLHLGHEAILKYRTQFATLNDMHDTIINNWNSAVTAQDKVYILGDVAWNKQALILLDNMNGKKVLIKGNHDILKLKEYVKYFEDIRGAMEYKGCILTHIPIYKSQMERYKINIHGHMHDKNIMQVCIVPMQTSTGKFSEKIGTREITINDNRYINVCCEQVNYTPVLLEDIIK
jgi:calcineurin-like phosphoesterase family protein